MSFQPPTTLEIDRNLREEFRRRVKDFGIMVDATDPALAVLFRTFAQQIEIVYADTGRMQQSLLDELMAGLQLPKHLAQPAQTMVQFSTRQARARLLHAGTPLQAKAASGERLMFHLDADVEISSARIALAMVYQGQQLQILSCVPMAESLQSLRPSSDPVKVQLGPQPALLLAFEAMPSTLLGRHGLFFELGAGSFALQAALCREPWWVFHEDGTLHGEGLMRPHRANGGVYELRWQDDARPRTQSLQELPALANGFYAGRQFVLPAMDAERKLLTTAPRFLEDALTRLVGAGASSFLATPRMWIKIPLPPNMAALSSSINGILLHAMTASNVFCQNQTLQFARDGVSVPVGRSSAGVPELLVAPLSVSSLANEPYQAGLQPRARASVGWYELHNDRILLHPGLDPDGSPQTGATVRLWLTNGTLGNQVGPGDVTGFASSATLGDTRVHHFTAAAGGTDSDDYAMVHRRFADALLSRGRIVTRADLKSATLSFDRRILAVDVESQIERRVEGLRRVEKLWIHLDSEGFTQVEIELPTLQKELVQHLQHQLLEGLLLDVRFEWAEVGTQ